MRFIIRFFATESAGGLLLMAVACVAMTLANSALSVDYLAFSGTLAHPVNDGLMAIFFLLIGMELKREIIEGELSTRRKAMLPVIGACSGVIAPALIYAALNHGDASAMRGWAVPCATDIAFALGVLSLLGARVPVALKVFLMAVAVVDDLIAVLIIAVFYTDQLNMQALGLALLCLGIIMLFTQRGPRYPWIYAVLGVALWACVLKSGVHATIAGVALGLAMPKRTEWEHRLHPWVAFGIMPLFAFANAGVPLEGLSFATLAEPVPLGVVLGLFFGKQLGIGLACRIAVTLGVAHLPQGVNWRMFYATCILAGIGFTMSLFVATLAFNDAMHLLHARLGVMTASLCSAIIGYMVLRVFTSRRGAAL